MAGPTLPAEGWKSKYGPLLLKLLTVIAAGIIGSVATWLGVPPKVVEVTKEVLVAEKPDADDGHAQGWVDDPVSVAAIEAVGPKRVFADTPAGQVQDLPKFVYGWKAYEKLLARPPPCKDQGPVGSCVPHGTNTAIERTLAAEIVARNGAAAEFSHFAEEVTYAGSRIEIGGGRIRPTWKDPNGDGSVGAWAKDFAVKWGMVPRQNYPGIADLTKYDPQRCRTWGRHDGQGVPAELEKIARQFPVKDGIKIANWGDAKRAMASFYFIAVCSDQGYEMVRDARGVCRPVAKKWYHCMAIDGYHTDEGGKEWAHIENSWGPDAHTGPVGWGNPTTAGFWADATVVDRMLQQNDSWAFSGITGFPARKPLDWTTRPQPRRDLFALNPFGGSQCDFSLAP